MCELGRLHGNGRKDLDMQDCSSNAPRTSSRAGRKNRKGTEGKKKFDFVIPVSWSMSAEMHISASNLEEALSIAQNDPLPDGDYADGSFEVSADIIEEYEINRNSLAAIKEIDKIDKTPRTGLPLMIGTLKTEQAQKYLEEKLKGGTGCLGWVLDH